MSVQVSPEDGYINMNNLVQKLGVERVLIHSHVWKDYLAHNHRVVLIRTMEILKTLIMQIQDKMPVHFIVDFGDEEAKLIADIRLSDKSLLIKIDGEYDG